MAEVGDGVKTRRAMLLIWTILLEQERHVVPTPEYEDPYSVGCKQRILPGSLGPSRCLS